MPFPFMFSSGERCDEFGLYETGCCGFELVVIGGAVFPECPVHKHPVDWKLISVIGTGSRLGFAV